MTGEEAGEDGAEDGPALRRIGDAKGLVEVAFEGFEGRRGGVPLSLSLAW